MKFKPLKAGLWLLALVASSALVDLLKLPGRQLMEKYPSVAVWALAIFLAEIIAIVFYAAFLTIEYFLNCKKQRIEELQRGQEVEKCTRMLDEQKHATERKEELEIVRRKCILSGIDKEI